MPELLLGCGYSRAKRMAYPRGEKLEFKDLVTLDINEDCKPDLHCDLDAHFHPYDNFLCTPLTPRGLLACQNRTAPSQYLKPEYFDEIHAYEVLEHLGSQGDAASFFDCFYRLFCLLRPNGFLFGTCPGRHSPWLWGDPSHRRAILQESLIFLSKERVAKCRAQPGNPISDFSHYWQGDFKIIASEDNHHTHAFCLQAIK
jgi:hypothetical protein